MWDTETLEPIKTITDFTDELVSVNFSNKNLYLVCCGKEGIMNIYVVEEEWKLLHSLIFDGLDIRHACFSPLDDRIVR